MSIIEYYISGGLSDYSFIPAILFDDSAIGRIPHLNDL